ncbi:hypothetical protein BH10PLA1_BH10PLA1_10560 [soil metagenome]
MARSPLPPVRDTSIRTDESLLWLGHAGHEVRESTAYYYNCRTRKDRGHVTLQYTLSGEGFYADARGRVALPAGWAFVAVIPGEFEYGYSPASKGPYELAYLNLTGPVAMLWHDRITQSFGHTLDLSTSDHIAPLMLAIARAHEAGTLPDRYLLSAQIYQVLMEIFSSLTRTRLSMSPRVTLAMERITARANDADFNVTRLAADLDCSREHLTRLFRAATGVSPSDYLTQQRLRRAAKSLRSSEDKLETIARQCGFSSANYFCRTFRDHVGTTPARFRRQPWLMGP